MARFIVRRLFTSLGVIFAVVTAAFFLIHAVPGDPVREMLGPRASQAAVKDARHQLGLDASLPRQFVRFVASAAHGDLGTSIVLRTPVSSVIRTHIVPTMLLVALSVIVASAFALPLAIVAAVRRDQLADHAIRVVGMVAFAMPWFWSGLLLELIFGLELQWLPVTGYTGPGLSVLKYLVLPACTLGIALAPLLVRTLRGALVESLQADYIVAAESRGFSPLRVVGRHALRNSFIGAISVMFVQIGYLLSSTVVVENVFGIPGLGNLLVQSVIGRDFPVVQGLVCVFGVLVVLINLGADIIYAWADPRVRLALVQ